MRKVLGKLLGPIFSLGISTMLLGGVLIIFWGPGILILGAIIVGIAFVIGILTEPQRD